LDITLTEKKKLVLAELKAKTSGVAELSVKYGVGQSTIRAWERMTKNTKAIKSMADSPKKVVDTTIDAIIEKSEEVLTPKKFVKVERELLKVKDGVNGLQALDAEFQTTFQNLLAWANSKIEEDMKVSEWSTIVGKVTDMYKVIFSQDNTNITVVNNQTNNTANVNEFKAGFRS